MELKINTAGQVNAAENGGVVNAGGSFTVAGFSEVDKAQLINHVAELTGQRPVSPIGPPDTLETFLKVSEDVAGVLPVVARSAVKVLVKVIRAMR